jgi:hypothetical protein
MHLKIYVTFSRPGKKFPWLPPLCIVRRNVPHPPPPTTVSGIKTQNGQEINTIHLPSFKPSTTHPSLLTMQLTFILAISLTGLAQAGFIHQSLICKLILEEKCRDEPTTECKQIQVPVTRTETVRKCSATSEKVCVSSVVRKCATSFEQFCETVVEKQCTTVLVKECDKFGKCWDEPKEKCWDEPRQVCKSVPEEKCWDEPVEECHEEPREKCWDELVTLTDVEVKQECFTTTRRECKHVENKVCH